MNKMEMIEKVGTRISCFMNNEPWSEWTIYENKTFEEVIEECKTETSDSKSYAEFQIAKLYFSENNKLLAMGDYVKVMRGFIEYE